MEDNSASPADKKILNQQQLNRNTIKRIKKTLVMQDVQYEGLRAKFLGHQASLQQSSNRRNPRKVKDEQG
jgi:peptidoglycan hydrolase CwlO-like protein